MATRKKLNGHNVIAAPAARTNKGRITRPDNAWGPAHQEQAERLVVDAKIANTFGAIEAAAEAADIMLRSVDRVTDIDEAYELAISDNAERIRAEVWPEVSTPATDLVDSEIADTPVTVDAQTDAAPPGYITIPLKFLAAALLSCAKKDIRYYLEGVFIHAVDGEYRICATDGHRMIVSRFKPELGDPVPVWGETGIILPRAELASALPILEKNTACHSGDCTEPCVQLLYEGAHATLRSRNGFATFRLKLVEGTFPDYMRVMANHGATLARGDTEALSAAGINTKYLRGAADVATKLGAKAIHAFTSDGTGAHLFTFDGAPDSVLIVMPMRAGEPVPDGVVKILGASTLRLSIIAFKAQITRVSNLLSHEKNAREREDLESRKAHFEQRVQRLHELTSPSLELKKQIAA